MNIRSKLFTKMKKQTLSIVIFLLVAFLILLYIINPLNRQFEFSGWVSPILLFIVILKLFNRNKKIDVFLRIMGVVIYLVLLAYYFLN